MGVLLLSLSLITPAFAQKPTHACEHQKPQAELEEHDGHAHHKAHGWGKTDAKAEMACGTEGCDHECGEEMCAEGCKECMGETKGKADCDEAECQKHCDSHMNQAQGSSMNHSKHH